MVPFRSLFFHFILLHESKNFPIPLLLAWVQAYSNGDEVNVTLTKDLKLVSYNGGFLQFLDGRTMPATAELALNYKHSRQCKGFHILLDDIKQRQRRNKIQCSSDKI